MTQYFILLYKKNSKKPYGVLPTRKGVSKDKLKKQAVKNISKRFRYRIITKQGLNKLTKKMIKR